MQILELGKKKEFIKLKVNTIDDLWLLSKIINKGDIVGSESTRIVKKGDSEEGQRKYMFIKINVEKIEFNSQSKTLRLLGRIIQCSNSEVPLNTYHTLAIEEGTIIEINKIFKNWEIQRLKEAEEASKRPKILLCAADYGEATIAVIHEYGVEYLTDVFENLSEKEIKAYEKNQEMFIQKLLNILDNLAKTNNIPNVILGGVGFLSENAKNTIDKFSNLKNKIFFVKIYHSGKTGINELIKSGAIESISKKNRVWEETQLVEEVFKRIGKNEPLAYGIEEVKKAIDYGAAETLLVSENLLNEYREKNKFEEIDSLMSQAEKNKVEIKIISTEHDAGERFAKLSIAALLRFKI